MATIPVNTANTLSTNFMPGQDILFGQTSSQSIFTFGNFAIQTNGDSDFLNNGTQGLSFGPYSTLENMGVDNFNTNITTSVQNNELRPVNSDPYSYSYFGSFYTEVARAINNIIDTYPYAALAFDDFNGVTIYDYSESFNTITGEKTSSFKIPGGVITNQGFVLFNSGSTVGNQKSLMTETNLFEIQLSGATTAQTESHVIKTYSYTAGTNSVLEFTISGHLSEGAVEPITGTTSTLPVYIRPSRKRMTEYRMTQSRLERQLLSSGVFDIPNINDERDDDRYELEWPRTIDGFNPDISGADFEDYQDTILQLASNVDMDKTDLMIKTIIPENYLDFDTDTQIYRKLVSSYAKQFDEIKQFIDNIAYAHSLNYNDQESVPEKFLVKLSNLLGWKLSSSFSDIDLFEYLADEDNPDQNSFAYYNVEIWKRILININWLYKKKGTRDALQFIFKLLGAPECLVVFNEFIYEIESTIITDATTGLNAGLTNNIKSNPRGYINYNASNFIFQEGGPGRGTGQAYIDQWRPQFNPVKKVDNIKVQVGDTAYTGSENIVNTKEVCATLDPANAIECDVFQWYQQSGTCWVWGSTAITFSSMTVPFEYAIDNCDFVAPENITAMTFNEYMEFIYTSNIEPRNRKTNSQVHTSWHYPELRKIYMNYYLLANPQSNMLTVKKLEAFLELLEVNFQDYMMQLIPATTILECGATTYRNTVFNRQRFVYKDGINDGSEFQVALPPDLRPGITPVIVSSKINDFISPSISPTTITIGMSTGITKSITAAKVSAYINQNNLGATIEAFETSFEVQPGFAIVTPVPFPGPIIPPRRVITQFL